MIKEIRVWILVFGAFCGSAAFLGAQTPVAHAPVAANVDGFALAERLFKEGQFARAATHFAAFSKASPSDPRTASAWLHEGVCHVKLGREDDAIRCWNWVVQRYPASPQVPEALEQLIAVHQRRANAGEANALTAKLVAAFPRHPATVRLMIARAEASLTAQRYEEAVKLLEPIREQLSPPQRRQMELARLYSEAKSDPAKLIAAADAAFEANDPDKAIPVLEAFLAKAANSPRSTEARVKLGWACFCLNDEKNLQRAETLWEEVIRKGPPTDEWVGESQWHMVQLLAGPRRKWKDAVARCELVARAFSPGTFRHEQALYTRAWLLWTQKQWAISLAAFRDFVKAYPHKAIHPPIVAYMRECEQHLANGRNEG